jgi:hypothetical protein
MAYAMSRRQRERRAMQIRAWDGMTPRSFRTPNWTKSL